MSFTNFLNSHHLITNSIIAIIGNKASELSSSFIENLVKPFLLKKKPTKLKINGTKLKIGKFALSLLEFLIVIFIIYSVDKLFHNK